MIKHPLVPVGILLAGGIWLGAMVEAPLPWLFASATAVTLTALLHRGWRSWLLWGVVFLAGWTNYAVRTAIVHPGDLRLLMGEAMDEVRLRGVLEDTPTVMVYGDVESPYTNSTVTVRAEQLLFERQPWQPASGVVMVNTRGVVPPDLVAGRRIEVSGVLQPPAGPAAPGLFDYRKHLRTRGIYYQLRVSNPAEWQALDSPRPATLSERFMQWAQATLGKGLPVEDEALRLTWAMLLGWKPGLTDEVSAPFMQTGTMHIFAISGLHIAMMAGILLYLLRFAGLRRGTCGVVVLPLIWFYTGATGWQASAIRSAIMASVMIAGWSLRRPSNLLNSLFASGVIIVLWDPLQLFQASFQLSFFVVLCLALLLPRNEAVWQSNQSLPGTHIVPGTDCQSNQAVRRGLIDLLLPNFTKWFEPDPLIPANLQPLHRIWALKGMRWLANSAGISVAAWFGSFPLIAHYFSLVTPISVAANLVVVPLSGLALACGMGSLLTGALVPSVGELFNHTAWFSMRCMVEISEWFAGLPRAYAYVPAPGPWFFVIYYGLLLVAATSANWMTDRRRGLVFMALVTVSAGWLLAASFGGQARLAILPVEDGQVTLWREKGDALLLDCGRGQAAERIVEPFLRAQGINRLPQMALTHGDLGQIGGAEFIRTNCRVEKIIAGPLLFRSPTYRELIRNYQKVPGLLATVSAGATINRWKVLHPATNDVVAQADDGALVLRGDFPGGRCLLLSDLGRSGQNSLMQRWPPEELRADLLVTGLPSQEEPLAEHLLLAVRPRLVIVADAMYPAAARASRRLQERLEHYRVPVLYTRLAGAVTIEFGQDDWRARSAKGPIYQSRDLPRFTKLPETEEPAER